jgi:hypothetical protein
MHRTRVKRAHGRHREVDGGLAKVVELASPVADPLDFAVGQADDHYAALCAGERYQWCPEIRGAYLH